MPANAWTIPLRLCKGVPKTHIYKAIRGGEVRVNKGRIQSTTGWPGPRATSSAFRP